MENISKQNRRDNPQVTCAVMLKKFHFKLFLDIFFEKILDSKNCEATKIKKIKGNKLDKSLLKVFVNQSCFYVSAFVGGIKKKHSPTSAFETNNVPHLVFDQNRLQIFLVKLTRKIWKHFFDQKLSEGRYLFQILKWESVFF